MVFVTPADGWMVGGPANTDLYVTRDGGRTWNAMAIHEGGDYYLPRFADPLHGYVMVQVGATAFTYRTEDGGRNWQAVGFNVLNEGESATLIASDGYSRLRTVAKAAYLSSEESLLEADFVNDRNGWLLASSGARTRLVAVDEGESVTDITPPDLRVVEQAGGPHSGGLDMCSAPAIGQMQAWGTRSLYHSVNVYIGGVSAVCSPPSTAWISAVRGLGWSVIPTWAGPQAPCSGFSRKISSSPSVAGSQGASEANAASDAAASLGLTNTAVFYDMENYDAANAACGAAVQDFVNGWVRQMHARGNLAGIYGAASVVPDGANADLPTDAIRRFAGVHSEPYGSVTNGPIAGAGGGALIAARALLDNPESIVIGPARTSISGTAGSSGTENQAAAAAVGGFKINVTYGNTVPAAAQTAFNSLVNTYQNLFHNNVTVNINVNFGTTGLGSSLTQLAFVSYTNWRAAVIANANANPGNTYAAAAAAGLPVNDPIGNGTVVVRTANARALGLPGNTPSDSTLTFNDQAAFEYTGVAASGKFDFMDVAAHELDEALGIGSSLTGIADNGPFSSPFEAEDYFRYSAPNTRAITTNPNAVVYFSYNGGTTNVAQFNQVDNNGDRNDWIYGNFSCPASPAYIQDARACSNQAVAVGPGPETIVLNTLGYNASGVPSKTGIFRNNGIWILDVNGDGVVNYSNLGVDRVFRYTTAAGDIAVTGDWNGDGRTKTGIFRNGLWILDANGNGVLDNVNLPGGDLMFQYTGSPGDIPVVGDWNGDGRTKTGVFRNGLWILDVNGDGVVNYSNLGVDKIFQYTATAGDLPVIGDWNGDGRAKTGVFRNNGVWILDVNGDGVVNYANLGVDKVFQYTATAGDLPVIGDWNGDGTAKTGVFRNNGTWILDVNGDGVVNYSNLGVDRVFQYTATAGDLPVIGDWNGDGKSKTGVFRNNGVWILDVNGDGVVNYSNLGVDKVFQYTGTPGDKPLVGRW